MVILFCPTPSEIILRRRSRPKPTVDQPLNSRKPRTDVRDLTKKLLSIKGKRTVTSFHRELGKLMWEKCGMARNEAGLKEALQAIPALREEFWKNVNVTGENGELNQDLEYAGRVADFLEFGELLCHGCPASQRILRRPFPRGISNPRRRSQARRRKFCLCRGLGIPGPGKAPILNKEPLVYEEVHMSTRSYK